MKGLKHNNCITIETPTGFRGRKLKDLFKPTRKIRHKLLLLAFGVDIID